MEIKSIPQIEYMLVFPYKFNKIKSEEIGKDDAYGLYKNKRRTKTENQT